MSSSMFTLTRRGLIATAVGGPPRFGAVRDTDELSSYTRTWSAFTVNGARCAVA
jgi:hypothetical protein